MRLIDADAFKEYLKNAFEEVKHVYTDGGVFAWRITEDFCRDIDEQPTINAEPERLTDDDFETIRIHLNAYKEKLCNQQRWEEAEEYQRIIDRFIAFASAQTDLQPICNNLATDLISRQDAIRLAEQGQIQGFEWQFKKLCTLPSAEPEIIRCRDCKHWYKDADSGMSCEYTEMSQPEDGFCNWAERRDE